jgi:hypothetical protein
VPARGKNGRHALVGMLRQAVFGRLAGYEFGRLAGYEDVNDAARLRHEALPIARNPRDHFTTLEGLRLSA